jgi:subtilisin family serine protease
VDPALRELLRTNAADEEAEVVLRLRDPSAVPPGVRVVTRFGDIVTGRVAMQRILEARDRTASMKAPRIIEPERGVAPGRDPVPATTDIRRPTGLAQTGRGVLIGVLDWGFSLANPAFRHRNGRTRVVGFWDQRDIAGNVANRFGYGRMFSSRDIDAALRQRDPYAALGYHPGDADDGNGTHGSHTLDIAAGNGASRGPVGLAPDADIALVHLGAGESGERVMENLGDSVRLLEGVSYLMDLAGTRPLVISASLGRHGGPHDGSTLFELALDSAAKAATARGARPFLLVNSAGNYRRRGIHAAGRVLPGEERTLRLLLDRTARATTEVELWIDRGPHLTFSMIAPSGDQSPWIEASAQAIVMSDGAPVGRVYFRKRDPQNGSDLIDIYLDGSAQPGEWTLALRMPSDAGQPASFHAWIERDDSCERCQGVFHPDDQDDSHTLSTLAHSKMGLTVGAANSHDPGRAIGPFSSAGPTRDGRVKPDCVAPGIDVLAARSPARGETNERRLGRRSGTSMAAPFVAGCAALVMEAGRGRLNGQDVKEILLATAREIPGERAVSGHGEVDARRACETALGVVARHANGGKHFVYFREEKPQMSPNIFEDPAVFRALVQGATIPGLSEAFQPVARERDGVQPGDLLLRRSMGEGGPTHVALVVSPEIPAADVQRLGYVAEQVPGRVGTYVQVVEAGARSRAVDDRFVRRARDIGGQLFPDQAFIRPSARVAPDTTDVVPQAPELSEDTRANDFDFSGEQPELDLMVDVAEEQSAHPAGEPSTSETVSLGEMMVRVMDQWRTEGLLYPKAGQSGIGPANVPGKNVVMIGGQSFPASQFRSCSPTTFRALMAALDNRLPDGRDMRKDDSRGKEILKFYKIWNAFDSVYGSVPFLERRGAGEVLGGLGLGRELAFGRDIRSLADLRRGDILQTWSRKVTKKDGTTVESWPGHSSIIYSTEGGLRTISATIPRGDPAIRAPQQQPKLLAAMNQLMKGGSIATGFAYQAVYIVRTTHQVSTIR